MRASGVRSSCETLASSSRSARSRSVTRSAIWSNARERGRVVEHAAEGAGDEAALSPGSRERGPERAPAR